MATIIGTFAARVVDRFDGLRHAVVGGHDQHHDVVPWHRARAWR
jgi:hypothetical protein